MVDRIRFFNIQTNPHFCIIEFQDDISAISNYDFEIRDGEGGGDYTQPDYESITPGY